MEQAARLRPSLWHCLWAVPFLLAGVGLFVYVLYHNLAHVTDALTQVVVPGSAVLHLAPATYTVFLEEQSEVNGRIYSTRQSVNGLTCRVGSVDGGAAIPLYKPDMSTTYELGGRSGRSVLAFAITQDGRYNFACDYGDGAQGPEVVVAVGSGVGGAIVGTVGLGFVVIFGGLGCALAVVLAVVLKRERERKRMTEAAPTPMPFSR